MSTTDHNQDQNTSRWADINVPLVFTIGLFSAIVVLGVAIPGIKALVYYLQESHMDKYYVETKSTELEMHQYNEREQITKYGWVSEEEGIARINIERAKELYADRVNDQ